MMSKAVFNWSGGKDSSMALHKCLQDKEPEISTLLTTINKRFNRITMHGVRVELVEAQADSIGIPLQCMALPDRANMEDYNNLFQEQYKSFRSEGIETAFFGDIFLEDLREYREEQMRKVNITPAFPVWREDTRELICHFVSLGFKALVVALDGQKMNKDFLGRTIDEAFIKDLPPDVDPCGENGEFHTFVYDGPIFKYPIDFSTGEVVKKEYKSPSGDEKPMDFWFIDLIPER